MKDSFRFILLQVVATSIVKGKNKNVITCYVFVLHLFNCIMLYTFLYKLVYFRISTLIENNQILNNHITCSEILN